MNQLLDAMSTDAARSWTFLLTAFVLWEWVFLILAQTKKWFWLDRGLLLIVGALAVYMTLLGLNYSPLFEMPTIPRSFDWSRLWMALGATFAVLPTTWQIVRVVRSWFRHDPAPTEPPSFPTETTR